MRKLTTLIVTLSAFCLPAASFAALPVGNKAPQFRTSVALDGKTMRFSLRAALRRGPVVIYFFPKAFTQGCTLEAHAFAEASDKFEALGATVVGLSADDLPTLQKFSTEECRSEFAVGVASPKVIKDYDVGLARRGSSTILASRTSYVIGRDGTIVMVHSDADYRDHVQRALAAVKKLAQKP